MVWCDLNSGLVRKAESKRPNITKSIWPKITIWPNLPNISTEIAHLKVRQDLLVNRFSALNNTIEFNWLYCVLFPYFKRLVIVLRDISIL